MLSILIYCFHYPCTYPLSPHTYTHIHTHKGGPTTEHPKALLLVQLLPAFCFMHSKIKHDIFRKNYCERTNLCMHKHIESCVCVCVCGGVMYVSHTKCVLRQRQEKEIGKFPATNNQREEGNAQMPSPLFRCA